MKSETVIVETTNHFYQRLTDLHETVLTVIFDIESNELSHDIFSWVRTTSVENTPCKTVTFVIL